MHSNTSFFRYQQRHAQQLLIRGGPIPHNGLYNGLLGELLLAQMPIYNSLLLRPRSSNSFLIQLRVMTQRQHVPTTELPSYYTTSISILITEFQPTTPYNFWGSLALGEPSPRGAHFYLHRFLSLGVRPLFCSLNSSDRRHRQFSA